ncbi:MAG TPA: CoA transferase [Candidatus Micrarchaeia archaeon]|nr:CoA transferase [Candidatus Micrarchaeia archaeon]
MSDADPPDAGGGEGPLRDLVVVDLSRVLAGPYATMLLADLGARVIKVERPRRGDDTRHWGPPFVGPSSEPESAYFLAVNRNKESIALDFGDAGDRALLLRLVARADVLVENFRPGQLARHGLDLDAIRQGHPSLVVLSISGFGPDGPDAGRPGYDHILQGEGGLMSVTGPGPGQPTRIGVPVVDILAGTFGAMGVLAALHERARTGQGQLVHSSLLGAAVASHVYQGTRWLLAGEVPVPLGNRHPTIVPYGAFRCGDRLIQIAVGTEAMWQRLAERLGLPATDPRFRTNRDRVVNVDALTAAIEARLATRPPEAWLADLEALDIPCGEIRSIDEVYGSAQVAAQGLVVEVDHPTLGRIRLPGPPLRSPRGRARHQPPPLLDEHGPRIRAWLGSEGARSGAEAAT